MVGAAAFHRTRKNERGLRFSECLRQHVGGMGNGTTLPLYESSLVIAKFFAH